MKTYLRTLLLASIVVALISVIFPASARAGQKELVIANLSDASVETYHGITGVFLATFVQPGSGRLDQPQDVAIGPDRNLYVTSWETSSVKRYSRDTGAFIDNFIHRGSGGLANPDQLIFRKVDGKLYVSSRFLGTISRYDAFTGAFVDTFVSDSRLSGFTEFTFGPDGNIYAGEFNGLHRVLRFSGITGQFIDVFTHGNPQRNAAVTGLTFGADGNLYACRWIANLVERYDGTTGAYIDDFVPAGSGGLRTADNLRFSPIDDNLYVCSLDYYQSGVGAVLRYDGTTGAFIDVFTSGGPPLIPKGFIFAGR